MFGASVTFVYLVQNSMRKVPFFTLRIFIKFWLVVNISRPWGRTRNSRYSPLLYLVAKVSFGEFGSFYQPRSNQSLNFITQYIYWFKICLMIVGLHSSGWCWHNQAASLSFFLNKCMLKWLSRLFLDKCIAPACFLKARRCRSVNYNDNPNKELDRTHVRNVRDRVLWHKVDLPSLLS